MRKSNLARWLFVTLFIAVFCACYHGYEKFPPADHSKYNIAYATGYPGEEYLRLDAFWPEGANNLPVLLYIHGGGWNQGDKYQMDVWSKRMCNRGYVVFNVNYRLAPQYPFPDAVNDCLGALLWVREHAAEYGGDPDRIGVTGGSAGGHLTAMVATAGDDPFWKPTGHENSRTSRAVLAQVPFFGIYDFNKAGIFRFLNLRQQFLAGGPKKSPDNYRRASPVTYLRKDIPPTLLVVGKLDPIKDQTMLYYKRLKDAGANVELITYALQTHAFDSLMWARSSKDAFNRMMDFFDKYVRDARPTGPGR